MITSYKNDQERQQRFTLITISIICLGIAGFYARELWDTYSKQRRHQELSQQSLYKNLEAHLARSQQSLNSLEHEVTQISHSHKMLAASLASLESRVALLEKNNGNTYYASAISFIMQELEHLKGHMPAAEMMQEIKQYIQQGKENNAILQALLTEKLCTKNIDRSNKRIRKN